MGGQDPPTGRRKPVVGWVDHCKSIDGQYYSRVLFDGKFHQAVAGWTANLSGFIQICLSLSHVVVGLTVRIMLCSVRSTRSGPSAMMLSIVPLSAVRLSVTLMCCAQTTERIKLPFRVRLPPSIVTLLYYIGSWPPKIWVRGTSPKFNWYIQDTYWKRKNLL